LKGKTTKVIATELFLSPKTVSRHIENAKEKFGCANKVSLIKQLLTLDPNQFN
jgi:DNA-binding CsgD family transcriptional regulator